MQTRVKLHPISRKHEDIFCEIHQNRSLLMTAFEQPPMQSTVCKNQFSLRLVKWTTSSTFPLTFVIKLEDTNIGLASIKSGIQVEENGEIESAFLTILIKKEYQGQGYGSQSLYALIGKCYSLGYKHASAIISEKNIKSIDLFSKLSFKGEFVSSEKKSLSGGTFRWMYFSKHL